MLKIEFPQPETTLPEEEAASQAPPARTEATPGGPRPRSEREPGTAAVAGTAYRRTFACVATTGEPEDTAKT